VTGTSTQSSRETGKKLELQWGELSKSSPFLGQECVNDVRRAEQFEDIRSSGSESRIDVSDKGLQIL
jgi:hypothetical protein